MQAYEDTELYLQMESEADYACGWYFKTVTGYLEGPFGTFDECAREFDAYSESEQGVLRVHP